MVLETQRPRVVGPPLWCDHLVIRSRTRAPLSGRWRNCTNTMRDAPAKERSHPLSDRWKNGGSACCRAYCGILRSEQTAPARVRCSDGQALCLSSLGIRLRVRYTLYFVDAVAWSAMVLQTAEDTPRTCGRRLRNRYIGQGQVASVEAATHLTSRRRANPRREWSLSPADQLSRLRAAQVD